MKKLKILFVVMLSFLVLPLTVFADQSVDNEKAEENETSEENVTSDETKKGENSKVKVYFFHGDGCPHCAEAEEFFEGIKEEYGSKFELVSYEVWYNEDNSKLMEKVAKARDEEVSGVPYIIIGEKSWNGYTSEYDSDIKKYIDENYSIDSSKRYDIMELVNTGSTNSAKSKKENHTKDVLLLLGILIVVGGVVVGVADARKKNAK